MRSTRPRPARPETVLEVLDAAAGYLRARGTGEARLSAELLMGKVLGCSRLQLYLAHDRPLASGERAALRALVAERGRGVPVAYLIGEQEFAGAVLTVTPDVLVPRPETEGLVDLAAELGAAGARCIDLGTGSGAIAVALAVRRPDVAVWAIDVHPPAAVLARRNAERNGVADRVHVLAGSFWQPLADGPPFDLVVGNPPYVDPARDDLIDPRVREHEPAVALFTRPRDPISAYREILEGLAGRLRAGGWILLETGVEAARMALALLERAPCLAGAELRNDLAGVPRYLLARAR